MDMMEEALQLPKDSKATFWAQVLSVGEVTSYKTRTGSEMRYFRLMVAANDTALYIRSYQIHMAKTYVVGRSYLFKDVS